MFKTNDSIESNLYILKVVDRNDEIKFLILNKRNIDKGESLLLNLNLIFK